jgi:hypothetical protein
MDLSVRRLLLELIFFVCKSADFVLKIAYLVRLPFPVLDLRFAILKLCCEILWTSAEPRL